MFQTATPCNLIHWLYRVVEGYDSDGGELAEEDQVSVFRNS
jgi:hypothetical protein